MIKQFTDQSFEQEVLKNGKTVLVDFWAPWCAPCLSMNPIIDRLAKEFEGQIIVGKINIDENKTTMKKYEVMSVPNIKIFQKGKVVKEFIGKQDVKTLISELNNFCEEKNDNQEINKTNPDDTGNISGCCPEENYCDIDCRPDDAEEDDIKKGCDCGGDCQ